jgi:transposase
MLKWDSCGIEVSAKELLVCVRREEKILPVRGFPNTTAGHRDLTKFVQQKGRAVHVCMEATGTYGLDLALHLNGRPNLVLTVVNPKAARRFAESLQVRNKTDQEDVLVLEEFARRMEPQPWKAPSTQALQLRALARRLTTHSKVLTAERNRLHAAETTQSSPKALIKDLRRSIQQLELARRELLRAAVEIIRSDAQLNSQYRLMRTIKGIAALSAVLILGELAVLAHDLTARQWVAFAGLDPRKCQSGTSVHKRPRLSKAGNKYLRRALYMPALVAIQRDPGFQAFYQRLKARGKLPLQAVVAAMRKLLHAIFGVISNQQPFDSQKLFASAHPPTQKIPQTRREAIWCQ